MNQAVKLKFETYPLHAHAPLLAIRALIFELALENNLEIEETLKWGQPSYLTKLGSTIRIDHSAKATNQIRIYFNCKTRIVETIKEVYGDLFAYETNRVLVFEINNFLPNAELKQCLLLSLKYHQLKQLPLLGM